jgi:hypothetical protein
MPLEVVPAPPTNLTSVELLKGGVTIRLSADSERPKPAIDQASQRRTAAFALRPFAHCAAEQGRYRGATPKSPRLVRFQNRPVLRQVHLCRS